MRSELSKEFIIEYLRKYYEQYGIAPGSRDKRNPFCGKSVLNKFGSWNNALIEANIPLYKICKSNPNIVLVRVLQNIIIK